MTHQAPRKHRYRTIWISDIHLGTRGAKARFLLDFLRNTESDTLYLVGDVVDGWRLEQHWYWPTAHDAVIQRLLRKARTGTEVIFLPGNHDAFARAWPDAPVGRVRVQDEACHTLADGRRLLVVHGDAFDGIVTYVRWLAHVNDATHRVMAGINRAINRVRRRFGRPYWSLSAFVRSKAKTAFKVLDAYEATMVREARARGFDGVVCGHVHHPACKPMDGVVYANTGDWMEHCSALVEDFDGNLALVDWTRAGAADLTPLLAESPEAEGVARLRDLVRRAVHAPPGAREEA